MFLAYAYLETGQEEKAQAEAAEVRRINPTWSTEELGKRAALSAAARSEQFRAALKQLGLE
jgi:hypothetical protein